MVNIVNPAKVDDRILFGLIRRFIITNAMPAKNPVTVHNKIINMVTE
jgi:hypothetical protein